MYKIKTLNNISDIGLQVLPAADFEVTNDVENPDGILLRSFDMNNMELPKGLRCVARAGAGVNNIPIEKCSEQGIVVFNTPGANANAVKELVVAGLLLSSRNIVDGINWCKSLKGEKGVDKLVEKGKAEFTGPEIMGKKIGIIGLGAIGVMVANIAKSLGMQVAGYDPFISVDAAWGLSRAVSKAPSLESILAESDYVTIHIPLNDKTKNMFNSALFANMKRGAKLLNFSRAELVDFEALKTALADGTIDKYVTDFPNEDVLTLNNVIAIPHLGASTPESEDNCAEMAAKQLKDFLEMGTVKNSVNFPECELQFTDKVRIVVLHKNMPNVVSPLTKVFGSHQINIDNMINKSKGAWAYTIIDVDDLKGNELDDELKAIDGVVSVRII